ncbi:hypothetical protein D3C80_2125670 [compost metagenome]
MRCAHLGATLGVLHALDGIALARDRPETALHVDLPPAGEAQFTGAEEHQQGQGDGQAGQRAPLVRLKALQQIGQAL